MREFEVTLKWFCVLCMTLHDFTGEQFPLQIQPHIGHSMRSLPQTTWIITLIEINFLVFLCEMKHENAIYGNFHI